MTAMALDFAWLGQGTAVDLANTYVPAQDADIVERWPGLAEWGVTPGRARELRELATTVIDGVIAGEPLPRELRALVNDLSESEPELVTLTENQVRQTHSGLSGAVARDLIRVIADRVTLQRCPAPGCGMVYVQTRGSQHWCSRVCGNRARVARHAARRKAPAT